ncbi:MAG: hypothetical protein OEV78_13175, partial [Spirochaetia bacterium]|nr:hypothetical protein [Spirochaetia bacterium]
MIYHSSPKQLSKYYTAVINDEDFILDNPKLLIIFLTPSSETSALKDEYVNLEKVINKNHSNAWLYWSTTDESNSVLGLIRNILIQESVSDINPINDYMKRWLVSDVLTWPELIPAVEGVEKVFTIHIYLLKSIMAKYKHTNRNQMQLKMIDFSNQL